MLEEFGPPQRTGRKPVVVGTGGLTSVPADEAAAAGGPAGGRGSNNASFKANLKVKVTPYFGRQGNSGHVAAAPRQKHDPTRAKPLMVLCWATHSSHTPCTFLSVH